MRSCIRLFRFCAMALLAWPGAVPQARATAYLDEAAWNAAIGGAATSPFPAHVAVAQDAFATYARGVPQEVTYTTGPFGPPVTRTITWILDTSAGQWGGSFACNSFAYPCLGAYRITYTLPFDIVGFAGTLVQSLGTDLWPGLPFFETPEPACFAPDATDPYYDCTRLPLAFRGFYGATFAPTRSFSILWSAGLISADDAESFRLFGARVVPAPEPASLPLLAAALGLLLPMRRRGASALPVASSPAGPAPVTKAAVAAGRAMVMRHSRAVA